MKHTLPGLRTNPSPLLQNPEGGGSWTHALEHVDVAGPFLRFTGCEYPEHANELEADVTLADVGSYKLSILCITRQGKPALEVSCVDSLVYPDLLESSNMAGTGFFAYRFDLEVPIQLRSQAITYTVRWRPSNPRTLNNFSLATHTFHVPGLYDSWHMAAFSCVGFSQTNKLADQGVGTSSLFANIADIHNSNPFHLLIGGGDQIYNDDVFQAVEPLKQYEAFETHQQRRAMEWTPELERATLQFYIFNYIMHLSDDVLHSCLATIPWITAPDDHDFVDGLGSYDAAFEEFEVWRGVKDCAIRVFQLFQNHNHVMHPNNPYGFCRIVRTSPTMSILAIDARTTRSRAQVLSDDLWAWMESLDKQVAVVKHLVVINPIPVIFGSLDSLQSILAAASVANQRLGTGPIDKVLRKLLHFVTGGPSQWRFGEPQLLDECFDRWSAHDAERFRLLQLFWKWSSHGTRVTQICGDVHCAAIGLFQHDDGKPLAGPRIRGLWTGKRRSKETQTTVDELHRELHDPKAMFQVVSSAIGNEPPPNWVRWMSEATDARLIPPTIATMNNITGRYENDDSINYTEGMLTFGKLEQRERAIHNQGLGLVHARQDHETNNPSFAYQTQEAAVHPALYAIDRPFYQLARILKRDTGRRVMRRRNWIEISEHEICGSCLNTEDATWIRVTLHAEKLKSLGRMLKHKHESKTTENKPEERKWELWIPALIVQ